MKKKTRYDILTKKYLICTRNLDWVETTNNVFAIGSKVRYLKNRGYRRSFIDVFIRKET